MSNSNRQQILQAFADRLALIQTADGYQTDAGRSVFFGEVAELGTDDPPEALAVVLGDDVVKDEGTVINIAVPVRVHILVKPNLEQPWVRVEQGLADIKEAVEGTDRTLGGLLARDLYRGSTRVRRREPGSQTVAASIEYQLQYVETYGSP